MTPEKNQQQDKKPHLKEEDALALKKVNIKNPAILFFFLMIPVFLTMLYTLMAKTPEEPVPPPPAAAPHAPAFSRNSGAGAASSAAHIAKMGRGSNMDATLEKKGCSSYDQLIGQKPGRELTDKISKTGRAYRMLPPGSQMTMDFSPQRINLELDDHGVIRRVWCG